MRVSVNVRMSKIMPTPLKVGVRTYATCANRRNLVSQKQEDLKLKTTTEFYNVPVPMIVMKQIGVGLDNLPENDDFRHLVVCINYFRK